ncbi:MULTISPECIES: queuosine precursor transporter [Pseudomonas]|uniref:queuosine precursor transporter n=1 Tax=Pseudomonas TaxID=286 RepID=UPI0021C7544C|nr:MULTISPECIES: queuosine precursor transporter [Pseudomonas]MCU1755902.1 queuosine precursor transporter [Pseudomonas helleri]
MTCKCEAENSRYKLLGFDNHKSRVIVMVVATGKVIKVKLSELISSEVMDNFNPAEVKTIHKKLYSQEGSVTAYDFKDRHERSWMIYVVLNLLLFTLYIFTSIAATKPIFLEWPGIVVTPGAFLYPLTFLIVDVLNESYGLRLARRAIFFAFVSNTLIIAMLSVTTYLPGLSDWKLDEPYNQVIGHLSSVLIASLISFLVSEYVNTYLLCKIKELTNSRFLFLRVFLSTFIAVIIDSFLFCFLAFYGVMETSVILDMIVIQILIKVSFAFFNVFPAYGMRALLNKYMTVESR